LAENKILRRGLFCCLLFFLTSSTVENNSRDLRASFESLRRDVKYPME